MTLDSIDRLVVEELRAVKRRSLLEGLPPTATQEGQHTSSLAEKAGLIMTQGPSQHHITYQQQYRKCGKPSCRTCRSGPGHGPYWYAYWREGPHLRSAYIGKAGPALLETPLGSSTPESRKERRSADTVDELSPGEEESLE
jgi:hypothetical protein